MRNLIRVIAVAAGLLALAACNPFPSATTTSGGGAPVDSGEVRSAVESYASKFNSHDAAGAAALYADDPAFHWIEGGRLSYATREAAVKGLTDFLTGFPE